MEQWKPIVLEVDFTPDDLRHFFTTHNKKNARGLRWIMVLGTLAFFFIALQLLALVWNWNPRVIATPPIVQPPSSALDSLLDMLIRMAPYVGGLLVLVVGLRLLQRALYSRAVDERNPYQRHHRIELNASHLIDAEPLSRHEFSWEAFNRWTETSQLLLLYVSANSAVLIPKRAFASADEIERCRGLLRAMIDTPRTARQAFEVLPAPPLPVKAGR